MKDLFFPSYTHFYCFVSDQSTVSGAFPFACAVLFIGQWVHRPKRIPKQQWQPKKQTRRNMQKDAAIGMATKKPRASILVHRVSSVPVKLDPLLPLPNRWS